MKGFGCRICPFQYTDGPLYNPCWGTSMTHKSAIPVVAYFLAAALWAGVGSPSRASQVPAVTMTLRAVTLTNDSMTAVFLVTNAGSRPVLLRSCGYCDVSLPLGVGGGRCKVPPGANCTMSVTWRPYQPGPYWWRFAVFEQSTGVQKAAVAAGRLEANVLGKAHYTNLWMSDLWSPAYEITSPTVAKLPQPDGPANRSQPTRSVPNRPPSAAGSGR
jgi:hypothetical protein